ncbi:MAG: hypothetical protein LBE55_04945, partial [Clostridiales bacterium]|nr:hypothetical protein [Clostridiales bacterium]
MIKISRKYLAFSQNICYNHSIRVNIIITTTDSRGDNIRTFSDIFSMAGQKADAKIAVACAADAHVLMAATSAAKNAIADFLLVGDTAKINEAAKNAGLDISGFEIIHAADDAAACAAAVGLVADGTATALMKGNVDTSVVMRAALDKEAGMRTGQKLSH